MIVVSAPNSFIPEREYIYNVLLSEFLGLNYKVEFSPRVTKTIISGDSGFIELDDSFFSMDEDDWLSERSMPITPLAIAEINKLDSLSEDKWTLPVIYGNTCAYNSYLEKNGEQYRLGIDVFGSAFFMLSRYEEYVVKERDRYDRFPANRSLAYKENFLDRPIINEYVEILWELIRRIAFDANRKMRTYTVIPTHDIDKPFGMMFDTPIQLLRHIAGDIICRYSFFDVFRRLAEITELAIDYKRYMRKKSETYDFILHESKKYDLINIFFFMNSKKSWHDGNYLVSNYYVKSLISKLHLSGHKIGLHPSFASYLDGNEIKKEANLIRKVLNEIKVPFLNGARQHYLRWKNPATWQYYEDAGLKYDYSLTYAESPGFRAGVCYSYTVYNLVSRKTLGLVEKPLIIMDGSLYDYMKLSHNDAMAKVKKLAFECKKYNGEFIILWHNTMLDDIDERNFYSNMLRIVCEI